MTNPYPIEVPGLVPGLSPAQLSAIAKAPYTEHFKGMSRVGAKYPRLLLNQGGLYYGGNAACADFTGTAEGGSGGPAVLPYGPTGLYTVVAAGHAREASADKFELHTNFGIGGAAEGLTTELSYAVAARRMNQKSYDFTFADWDPTTRKLELAGGQTFAGPPLYPPLGPTGDDWVWIHTITGGTGATGWYRVDVSASRAIDPGTSLPYWDNTYQIILTADAATTLDAAVAGDGATVGLSGTLIKSAQAGCVRNCVWDDATGYLSAFGVFGSGGSKIFQIGPYTPGADDIVEIVGGSGYRATYSKVVGKISDHPLPGYNDDTLQIADTDIATAFKTEAPNAATYDTATRHWVSPTPDFAGYTFEDGNLFLVTNSSDPTWIGTYMRITAKVSDYELVFTAAGSPAGPGVLTDCEGIVGHVHIVLYWNKGFSHYQLDPANPWTEVSNPGGVNYSTLHIDPVSHPAGMDWTPGQLDVYYVYVNGDTVAGAAWPNGTKAVLTETDPENCPTRSAARTLYASWPYWSPTPSAKLFYKSYGGVTNVIAAPKGTEINHAWHGLFQLAPECFMPGDAIEMRTISDVTTMGTPYFIEVMVIPNFDPEEHWVKDGSVVHSERMTFQAVWFHSPIITETGIWPIEINLRGKAGAVQTIGSFENTDTISMQWSCEFKIGNLGGDGSTFPPEGFPRLMGPISRVLQPRLWNRSLATWTGYHRWHEEHTRWTVLIKAEHPSLRGRPGYHGHYMGEPFSATTGNGGVLLSAIGGATGLPSTECVTPWAPRWRTASVDVVWTPGGNY